MTNWKTTLAGVGAILVALGHAANAFASGDVSGLGPDIMTVVTGVGLMLAKDGSR